MSTIQFEPINNGNPYTTYFYNNEDVDLTADVESSAITMTGVPMWTGQTVPAIDTTNIRSIEVYLDADDDNLSNGLAKFKYLGTDPYPTTLESEVIYVRLDGTALKAKTDTTVSNLIIVVITD